MNSQKYSVEHIGLAAENTLLLRDWYMRTLGAKLVFENDQTPQAFLLELPGALLLEIYPAKFQITETAENTLAGWRHLALTVDSIEASRAELSALGVVFESEIKQAGGGGRVLFFRDPENNILHFVERPDAGWRSSLRSASQ